MVEVVLEYRLSRILPLSLFALVPFLEIGFGRALAAVSVFDAHEHDCRVLWTLLWLCRLFVVGVVLQDNLRCRQG